MKMKKKTKVSKPKKSASTSKKTATRSKERIIPLNDRILLRPLSVEESSMTASGIIIPDTVSKEKPEQGVVVAVGEGKWEGGKRLPMSIRVGDKVVFSRYGYDEVKIDDEEYYILREENILAVINN
jgi:chaperonin GroES